MIGEQVYKMLRVPLVEVEINLGHILNLSMLMKLKSMLNVQLCLVNTSLR
jgi:hypothetical protein